MKLTLLLFIAALVIGLIAIFIIQRFIIKNRIITSLRFALTHILIGVIMLVINIILYRNRSLSGQVNYHDFDWTIRRLINIEQFALIVVHPFDLLVGYFFHGKPFETSWIYELFRILTLPFSTLMYLLLSRNKHMR